MNTIAARGSGIGCQVDGARTIGMRTALTTQQMKARPPMVFAPVFVLVLFLALVVTTQRALEETESLSISQITVVNPVAYQESHLDSASLAYTSSITFTPVSTIYLPLIQHALVSDFAPCVGAPSGKVSTPERSRALIAYSTNGLAFQRPANPNDSILIDRAGVPDGVVLPSGRILVYFVNGCRPTDPANTGTAVAVSDQHGAPGSWVFKHVRYLNVPDGYSPMPFDPNVVLLPDGNLRMFTSMFGMVNGSPEIQTHSFRSTDGGFTFTYEGLRYEGILDPENYRFSDTNWQIITGSLPTNPVGWAMSTDGGNTFQTLGMFPNPEGAPHEIAVTDEPDQYRVYVSTPTGIKSYHSAAAPWTTWTEEPGYRLQVDSTTGLESCEVAVPTVLKLGPGNYLMVYLTVIPGCGCSEDPICP